jgi:hypothetical protein
VGPGGWGLLTQTDNFYFQTSRPRIKVINHSWGRKITYISEVNEMLKKIYADIRDVSFSFLTAR